MNRIKQGRRCHFSVYTILTSLLTAKVSGFVSSPSVSSRARIELPAQRQLRSQQTPSGLLQSPDYLSRTYLSSKQNPFDFSLDDDQFKQAVGKTFASIVLGLVLIFGGTAEPANAGFGPSSRAVTSQTPNLIAPRVQAGDFANSKKLKQLIGGTIDANRLEQFSIQLDELAEELKNLLLSDEEPAEGGEKDFAGIEQREAELGKARILQQQIMDQERLLGKLEKQPYWFNYLAAFTGSVASTLIMHPVDTIKTRLQLKKSDDDEKDEGIGNLMSLYEGLTGNILKEGPPSALYLGVYESVKYALLPQFGAHSVLLVYLASGAAGEMVGSIIRAPAEAIKSTVQSGIASTTSEAVIQVFGTADLLPYGVTHPLKPYS